VIRKVVRGGKMICELVGECYVHEIMRGADLEMGEVERITLV
jgi:hypothetical protein